MPLTANEREFLDAYVYEATHEPFIGPATTDLQRRQIYYADLHGLLTAYHRELTAARVLPFGKRNHSSPPSPWANRAEVECRSRALLDEYGPLDPQISEDELLRRQQSDKWHTTEQVLAHLRNLDKQ